jgi:hypothetical protein
MSIESARPANSPRRRLREVADEVGEFEYGNVVRLETILKSKAEEVFQS